MRLPACASYAAIEEQVVYFFLYNDSDHVHVVPPRQLTAQNLFILYPLLCCT